MEESLIPPKYHGENSHEHDIAMDRLKYGVCRVQHLSGHSEVLCGGKLCSADSLILYSDEHVLQDS